MRSLRAFFLVSLAAVFVFMSSAPAVAQVGPGTRTLANGQILSWTDFYELDQQTATIVDGVELLDLYSPFGWFRVITTNFPAYGNVLRDLSVEDLQSQIALQQVDRGDYDNVSYSLDTTTYDGVVVGIFTLVVEQANYAQLTMIVSPVELFQYEMQIAQSDLTIGGAGVFQGVDPVTMQGHLTRATGVALSDLSGVTPTPIAPPSQATIPTPTPAAAVPPANVTTIPSSGAQISYSNEWSVQSQGNSEVSIGTSGPPAVVVSVLDLGPVTGAMDAAALAAAVQQQVANLADAQIVAALNPSSNRVVIVYRDPDPNGTLYRIYDIDVNATATTSVTVLVAEADVDAGVALVGRTVQVNGKPVMTDLKQLVPAIFPAGV